MCVCTCGQHYNNKDVLVVCAKIGSFNMQRQCNAHTHTHHWSVCVHSSEWMGNKFDLFTGETSPRLAFQHFWQYFRQSVVAKTHDLEVVPVPVTHTHTHTHTKEKKRKKAQRGQCVHGIEIPGISTHPRPIPIHQMRVPILWRQHVKHPKDKPLQNLQNWSRNQSQTWR